MCTEHQVDGRNVAVRRVEVRNDLLLSFIYVSRQGAETPAAGILEFKQAVVLTQGLRRFRYQWSHCGSCPTGPDSRGAGLFYY